jgi:hypothetical protein
MSDDVMVKLRLALRVEGDYWVAYAAERQTLEGSVVIGSIRLSAVIGNHNIARKEQFINLMKQVISDAANGPYPGAYQKWSEPKPAHDPMGEAQ